MARATCTAACVGSACEAANQAATALTPLNTTAIGYQVADLKVMASLRRRLPMRVRWRGRPGGPPPPPLSPALAGCAAAGARGGPHPRAWLAPGGGRG